MACRVLGRALRSTISSCGAKFPDSCVWSDLPASMASTVPVAMGIPSALRYRRHFLCSTGVAAVPRTQHPQGDETTFRVPSADVHAHRIDAGLRRGGVAGSRGEALDGPLLAHELEQGALAKWCTKSDPSKTPPTAVLVHGILGNKRNLKSFTRMLLEEHQAWQVLLVDLRAHGDSATLTQTTAHGPPSVDSAASDVLHLLRKLKIFPNLLVGHSFGGKVVMSMAEQFGSRLPRPVSVWVLDTVPGALQGAPSQSVASPHPLPKYDDARREATGSQADHPRRLIQQLQQLKLPISSRSALIDDLLAAGFSDPIARWVATNLRPARAGGNIQRGITPSAASAAATSPPQPRAVAGGARSVHNGVTSSGISSRAAAGQAAASTAAGNSRSSQLVWSFDLDGIAAMYDSYEQKAHWDLLESPPQGLSVDFVRAEHSNFRWSGGDAERITALGHAVHFLQDAGHWVHTDNPKGLLKIMEPAFGSRDDVQAIHANYARTTAAAQAVKVR